MPSITNLSLRRIFPVAFALIFTFPFLIFFMCVIHFGLLYHSIIHLAFVGFLTCALLGYILLRQILDNIIQISTDAAKQEYVSIEIEKGEFNELKQIALSFDALVARLEENTIHLGKRINELSTLREITDISSKIIDMKLLFGIVLEKVMITTDSTHGTILSLSRDGKRLKLEVIRGISESTVKSNEIDMDSTISGFVIQESSTLVSEDPAEEKRFNPVNDAIFEGGPFLSKVIKARGKTIGVLNLSRGKEGKPFLPAEVDYISTVLGHVGFAIDNAQLINEMREAFKDLKEMQKKVIHLERQAAINQTVVTLSHKLNNPLSVIQGYIELLRKNIKEDKPAISRSFDSIEDSIKKCNEVMEKLRDIYNPVVTDYAKGDIQMIDVEKSSTKQEEKKENED